jgi:sugar lactone lactonase YvrE
MNTHFSIAKPRARRNHRIFLYFTVAVMALVLSGIYWPSGSLLVSAVSASVSDPLWQEVTPVSIKALTSNRQSQGAPQHYRAFELNEAALADLLAKAPMEFTEAAKDPQTEIKLPMPDGALARFGFVESPIMEPELAAQFPEIRTYRGWGLDDPTATTRFTKTGSGLHAIVLKAQNAFYIEPLSGDDTHTYMSYFLRDAREEGGVRCRVSPDDGAAARQDASVKHQPSSRDNLLVSQSANSATGTGLRTFRLAVAATGEYTNANGGTVDSALAAINTTINNINAIYEQELAVNFMLVGNNNSIIFTDPLTDPYTSGDVERLVEENQLVLTLLLSGHYDIGHVFDRFGSSGMDGLVTGAACHSSTKGKGASKVAFTTSEVALHEFGHQLGALHTFNGDCDSRHDESAYEPGSGSTIMAYPGGRCANGNIIDWSMDRYFHGKSLQAITEYINNCGCGTTTGINNTPPSVTAQSSPLGTFLIPKETPFTLTASATDAEDVNLKYCWEEIDRGTPGPPGVDRGDNPLFRSLEPIANPSRTFPTMQDILRGRTTLGETLPTTSRSLRFRVTVRDNHPSGGAFAWDEVQINVDASKGPFTVTQPAAGTQVLAGSSLTVTWNPALTNLPPFPTNWVRILLSTDDGSSFTTELAASTPNDGSFTFTVPCASTQQARIKVEAVGNIFFNVSPPFTIIGPTITTTGSLMVTRGSPSATAQVATVSDECGDAASRLMVTTTTSPPNLPPPNGVTIIGVYNINGSVSVEASADCTASLGTRPITLQVTNSAGISTSTTFNITVSTNQPPTLGNYNNATVIAGQMIEVPSSAPPSDPNRNLRSITASIVAPTFVPGSATFEVDQTSGLVRIITSGTLAQVTHRVRVEAIDSCDASGTRDFFLTVINSPPQVALSGNSVRTTQGAASPFAPITIATVSDQQEAAGNLEVSADAPGITFFLSNKGGTIAASAIATCAVTPDTYTATLTVKDRERATATATFPVIVDQNPPPTLGTYFDAAVTVGGSVTIVPTVPPSDPNNAVSFSASPQTFSNGKVQVIAYANGRVRVDTQPDATPSIYQIFVTARDACDAQTTKSFKLTVRSATCPIEQSVVFAADTGNHRIQRFNGNNWNVIGPGTQGSGLGQFTSPEAVVASLDGRKIYIADTGNLRIQWSQDGGATWAVFASGLIPQGLVLDRDGHLYAADARDNLVLRYTGGVPGTAVVLARSGSGAGQVRNPNGLAIDCRMNLYVADTGNNRILVIATADSTMIAGTGTVVANSGTGLNPAQVTAPQGVAVDHTGKLYIADTGNNRVLTMTSAPTPGAATALCTLGPALGQVRSPEGVTIAAFTAGPFVGGLSLLVSDTANNRIQGRVLPAGSWMLVGTGQFRLPSKIR